MMVRCNTCGTELPADADYCFRCGSRIGRVVSEEFSVATDDLVKRVKDLLHEGNVRRILVKDEEGKVLFEVPATAGVIGVVLAPWLAALGAIAALATRCTITVERRE